MNIKKSIRGESIGPFLNTSFVIKIPSSSKLEDVLLRTVSPLVLRLRFAHLGTGPRYSSFLRNLPTNTKVFWRDL